MAMGHRKKKKKHGTFGLELNMTAMADVVFQLLIYLILTAKPPIVFANLDVNRPQADAAASNQKIPNMVEIMVFQDAFVLQGKRVMGDGLRKAAKMLADLDKSQTILIKCAWDSPHEKLIEALDICSEMKLSNLSVMSM